MHDSVGKTIAAFESWKEYLITLMPNAHQTMNQLWGWNMPSVTRADIQLRIDNLIEKLEALPDALSGILKTEINESPARLTWIRDNVLPNMSGNSMNALEQMYQEIDRLDRALPAEGPDWEKLADDKVLPKRLATRLRAIEAHINVLEPRTGDLESKIRLIEDATASAEQLPADLATLAEGRNEVAMTQRAVGAAATKVEESAARAGTAISSIEQVSGEAEKLFERLEDIYKAGSTKGLASAFAQRATGLNRSLYFWVFVLVVDLGVGAWIGAKRFEELQKILTQPVTATAFWANFIFSLLSVAAPIWLGWVATKQINQRFKLAEDYSFKASVASAYEGYKSEAVRLDPAFEKRLFGSALTRLEEAPLRFVDAENFGTPWHELTSSPAFAKALDLVPDLKGTIARIITTAGGAAAGTAGMLKSLGAAEKAEERQPMDESALERED